MSCLKGRLKAVFDLIKDGAFVADIGTDHAYLPIALHLSGKAKKIIACDIKEKPLLSARKNLDKAGCSSVETRLCDGLSGIKKGEADTIVAAGMGGEVISNILFSCDYIKDKTLTLILQPMTSSGFLRKRLLEEGFEITCEIPLEESKKIYSVICARYTGISREITPKEYFIGKISPNHPFAEAYYKKQISIIDDCINSFNNIKDKSEQLEFYSVAKEEILRYRRNKPWL